MLSLSLSIYLNTGGELDRFVFAYQILLKSNFAALILKDKDWLQAILHIIFHIGRELYLTT